MLKELLELHEEKNAVSRDFFHIRVESAYFTIKEIEKNNKKTSEKNKMLLMNMNY